MAKAPAPTTHPAFNDGEDDRSARSVDLLRSDEPEDTIRAAPESDNLSAFEAMLENDFEDVALPSPPTMDGWHLCWLTTTSTYDTLQKRSRLGYSPVKQTELPNFVVGDGSPDGLIRCNEMLLCKISADRYQVLMTHYHHKKPLEDEQSVVARMRDTADLRGAAAPPPGSADDENERGMFGVLEQDIRKAQARRPVFV